VAPAWRRKGIAGKLLATAEEYFHDTALWLYTEPFSAGYKLYLKRGYLPVMTEPDHYGEGCPGVLLRKRCR
jgi:GNAT superfamily N-acetyltransferase